MHIIECYVENFGKLHKETFSMENGLNVICEGNGSGKTTLAAFIRAMFYGIPATRTKKTLDDAERKKYKPWQGGMWGGYLLFEKDQKCYRIERTFSDRDSGDTFRLLDRDTGLVSEDFSKNIGEEIFGIDRAGFSSSIYIANNDLRVSLNDSLSAKIGDTPLEADDLNHYDQAMERLNGYYKKYGKNGKPHVSQELEECRFQYAQKKEKYEALALVTQPVMADAYPKWKLTAEQMERLEELDDFFGPGIPEEAQLKKCKELILECKRMERRKEKMSGGKTAYENKRNYSNDKEDTQGKHGMWKVGFVLLFVAVIGFAVAAYGVGGPAGNLVGVVAFLLAIVAFGHKRKLNQNQVEEEDGKEIRVDENRIVMMQKKLLAQAAKFLSIYHKYQNWSDGWIEEYADRLELLEKYRMEYIYLSEKDHDYREAEKELRNKEKQHAQDIYEKEREKLRGEIHDIEIKIKSLDFQYEESVEKMALIGKTKKLLEDAHSDMIAGYMYGIRQYFTKYMELFDSQLAERLSLNIAFQVGIEEDGIIREMDYYSQGYKDVIRLCQRLALTESLFQKEKPFIILDDPFINLDDEMLGRAKNALQLLSEHMQVIYFTCSWTREPEENSSCL